LLSIVLTRLWSEAKARRAGEQQLSRDAYDRSMRNRLDLDRFLSEQLSLVASTRKEDVSSGLVADVLYRHTTDYGTAKELSWSDLCELYRQLATKDDHAYLQSLVRVLGQHSLLVTVDGSVELDQTPSAQQITRLVHDTLATPVRKNYQKSDLPGQRAERRLMSRIADWRPSEPEINTLDRSAIHSIQQGSRGMRGFTKEEECFIKSSVVANNSALRRSWRNTALVVLAASIMVGLIGGYFGTISVWRADAELSHGQGVAKLASFQTPSGLRVLTHDSQTAVIWEAATGQELERYECEKFDFRYPYLILRTSEFRGSETFANFKIVNVESQLAKELKLGSVLENSTRTWIDNNVFFLSKQKILGQGRELVLVDLETAKIINTIEPFDDATQVYAVDSDRLLLVKDKSLPPEIWSVAQGRALGQLAEATDKWSRTIAIGVEPNTKRVATVQKINAATTQEPNKDEMSDERNTENDKGDDTSIFSVRIWNLTKEAPRIVVETPINMEDVVNQLNDSSPETGIVPKAWVGLSESVVVLNVWVQEYNRTDSAIFLFNSNLQPLDNTLKHLARGFVASAKRKFMYLEKPDKALALWDIETGQRTSLSDFFYAPNEYDDTRIQSLNLSQNGDRLLAHRENSRFELWKIGKDTSRALVSMQATNLKRGLFTLEDSAIAAWQQGGQLTLWTLAGEPMGLISGIAGDNPPSLYWNATRCEATIWTAEGRVLKFVYEWEVLGLFNFKKNGCTSKTQ
jgi:hypothetical protein